MVLSVAAMGMFGARCGWVQHEGGHSSFTGRIALDKHIQYFTAGFGLACTGSMWNLMHNKHHATPQKIKYDMDLDTTPFAAFFTQAIEANRAPAHSRSWLSLQAWTFLPVTSGMVVSLFWVFFLHPRQVVRDKSWEEGLWMASCHVLRTAAIKYASGFSWGASYFLLWAGLWSSFMYLFGHFALSHTHTDTIGADEHVSWVRYAVDHTVDIDTHKPWVNWVMGYLNCQVIHHLFPNMPQFRQPDVTKRFKAFAAKWDLDYQVMSYPEAWYETFKNLNDVGRHFRAQKREGVKTRVAKRRAPLPVPDVIKKEA